MSPALSVHEVGRHSLLRQVASFAPGSVIPATVSLGIAVVFTRLFDTAEFGRYSLMLSVAVLVTTLATQWLQQGIGRYLPGASAAGRLAEIRTASAAAVMAVLVLVVLSGGIAVALLGPLVGPVWLPLLLPTVVLICGTSVFEPLVVVLQSSQRGARFSAYRAMDSLLRFALGLAAVLFIASSAGALLWGMALAPLLLVPMLWRDTHLPTPARSIRQLGTALPQITLMMRYGMPMLGWFVASYILNLSDRYIIQLFRGAGEVGIYSANYSLASGVAALIAAPVLLAAHPRLMQAWDAGRTDMAETWLGRIVEVFLTGGALLFGLLLLLSENIAGVLLGAQFREGHIVMAIAFAGTITWQLGIFAQKPLEFTERVRVVFAIGLAVAIFNVAANVAFVPRYGYVAAAWTTVASYMLYAIVTTWLGRRVLRWRVRWRPVAGTLGLTAAGLLAAGMIRATASGTTSALITFAVIAAATSALVTYRVVRSSIRSAPEPPRQRT